jgi:hypothetical protein
MPTPCMPMPDWAALGGRFTFMQLHVRVASLRLFDSIVSGPGSGSEGKDGSWLRTPRKKGPLSGPFSGEVLSGNTQIRIGMMMYL